jgi:hypothetical protein
VPARSGPLRGKEQRQPRSEASLLRQAEQVSAWLRASLSQLVRSGYVVHHITATMLSVRLCCPAGAEIMFLLLSAKSVAGLHNIIGDARKARPVGDLACPEREGHRRELADIGAQQLETPPTDGNQRCGHRSGQIAAAPQGLVGSSGRRRASCGPGRTIMLSACPSRPGKRGSRSHLTT